MVLPLVGVGGSVAGGPGSGVGGALWVVRKQAWGWGLRGASHPYERLRESQAPLQGWVVAGMEDSLPQGWGVVTTVLTPSAL